MNKFFTSLALVLLLASSGFAQTKSAYHEKLTELFKLSGTQETYQVAIVQMFKTYKQQAKSVDAAVWDKLEKEFLKTSMDDLIEMLVPVYQKHLTIADLQGLIAFYKTPVGKKYAVSTPLITGESMQVGAEWGQKVAQKLMKTLEEEGY